jgi:MFS family permease
MTNWLGKYWPLRLVLWLLAAALCLLVWPVAVWDVLPRERLNLRSQGFQDGYPYIGEPVVLVGRGVEAWDWKADKRWRIPVSAIDPYSLIDVVSEGRTRSLAEIDWERNIITVTDVMPPHAQRTYTLPEDWEGNGELVMIDSQEKFAVVTLYTGDGMDVHVVELATARIADTKAKMDQAFTLGNGDVELVVWEQVSTPTPDIVTKATRWKLSDTGELMASDVKPVTKQPDLTTAPGTYTMMSSDGRYEISTNFDSPMVIKERASGRVLTGLSISDYDITDAAFSADGKYLLVGNSFTNFRVFDLENQTLVADDHRLERRWRRSVALTVISAIPLLLALALAFRTPSFERMAWDYLLASVFLDSCLAAVSLVSDSMVGEVGGMAAVMAIGIYWAFGPGRLWIRLLCGIAAIAVLVVFISGIDTWVNESEVTSQNLAQGITMIVFVATNCGVAGWLMTLPWGWRIARDESFGTSSRSQFGISTICLAITIAAVIFAMVRRMAEETAGFLDTQLEILAAASTITAVWFLLNMLSVWLLLWLWFRRHTRFSLILTISCVSVFVGLLLAALVVAQFAYAPGGLQISTLMPTVYEMSFSWTPLLIQLAWLSCALWLARRHGYQWVKPSKPVFVIEDAVGAVT